MQGILAITSLHGTGTDVEKAPQESAAGFNHPHTNRLSGTYCPGHTHKDYPEVRKKIAIDLQLRHRNDNKSRCKLKMSSALGIAEFCPEKDRQQPCILG